MESAMHGSPTSIRLDPDLKKRYDSLAARTGRSRAFYINKALQDSIEEFEYVYNLEQQVLDYRAGKLKTYDLDEVRELLGLEN
ncbi:type II toxin-antitoxin system RelB family antitoxin [Faecalibaculum rodentium]|uniref:type II toxin-antitoxin system RelB family antitoxin n=1 Tax=Faecalibaculum rodentium TaxID=1702221 RepID=UPI0023F445A3|nr:ribbon-helix-helix domain-containing protein [Faecalibaculum rodentium]